MIRAPIRFGEDMFYGGVVFRHAIAAIEAICPITVA
jgi:hypothetical protein